MNRWVLVVSMCLKMMMIVIYLFIYQFKRQLVQERTQYNLGFRSKVLNQVEKFGILRICHIITKLKFTQILSDYVGGYRTIDFVIHSRKWNVEIDLRAYLENSSNISSRSLVLGIFPTNSR